MTTARLYCRSFPCFLIICQVFTEFLSPEARKEDHGCPEPDFACGNLGRVGFPFYPESAWAHCGLSKLDCSATPYPELDLGGGRVYEVVAKESLFLRVVDRRLERLLSGQSCRTFYQNFSLPVSPAISFEVFPNLTLFRCHFNQHDNSQNEIETMHGHFNGFQRYDKCSTRTAGGFVVFYKKPYEGQSVAERGFPPPVGCSRIQLPIPLSTENMPRGEGPFGLVNATFLLEWSLSADCSECRDRRGFCIVDRTRRYRCSKGKVDSELLLHTVLGVAALVVGILLCTILIVMISKRRRRRLRESVYTNFSRNKSPEGSRKDYGVAIFTHKELEKATNHFAPSRELGNGGFGTVYYGKLPDGREVAVKYLFGHSHKRKEQFVNEIEILARMRHPNLVTLYGCTSRHGHELLLVYEYVPNGTLSDHLHGKRSNRAHRRLDWRTRMDIAVETARALAYLHASDVIHRDVKTSNILLTRNFSVKVADFGLSRLFPSDVTHVSTGPQGTPGYVDPEYHKCYHLTDKSDVYSFGVVLIELVSSLPAVDVSRDGDEINLADLAMKRILSGEMDGLVDRSFGFESDESVRRMTSSVAALGFQCLQPNREMRPTMAEVLQRLVEIQGEKETTTTTTTTTTTLNVECEKDLNSPISVIQKWGSSRSNMDPSTSSID